MTQALAPDSALKAAVDHIGSQGRFARLCGVKQPTVWRWLNRYRRLPPEHVLKVEAATGISRHDLRPDIYPVEPNNAQAHSIAPNACPAAGVANQVAGHPSSSPDQSAILSGGRA